jgi:excisionase family DNA binding protein
VSTPKIQTYSPRQTCELLSISRSTLDRLVKAGRLKKTKLGNGRGRGTRTVFRATEIERCLDRGTR